MDTKFDDLTASQKITAARISVHLQEASEAALARDLAEVDKLSAGENVEEHKRIATDAHEERMSGISSYAHEFAILENSADATADARRLVQIVRYQGAQGANSI